jgi:hypothetical protein
MFQQYVESHHQAFLNNILKIIKDIKRIIQNNINVILNYSYLKFISVPIGTEINLDQN